MNIDTFNNFDIENEELSQVSVLAQYMEGRFSLQEACSKLGVHRSTLWRKIKRLQREGRDGLVHKLTGRRSNNSKPAMLKQKIQRLHESYQGSLNTTQFYEKIVKPIIPDVSYSTVLRWLKGK